MVPPALEGPPPPRHRYRLRAGLAVAVAVFSALAVFPSGARAETEDAVAIESITTLNKRALEEYDNLNFDKARKTLNEALDLCSRKGLDSHPIKARTLIHLGVVALAGGASQREDALKQFQKALAIQPDIKLTERVANPEVQSAFDEAKTAAVVPGPGEPPTAGSVPQKKEVVEPAPATEGLSHDPVTSGAQGSVIPISVTTDPALEAKKVILTFRPDGAAEFTSINLKEYSTGNWSGSIPDSATGGAEVAYALIVQNEGGEVIGTQGSEAAPIVIGLKAARAASPRKRDGDDPDETEPAPATPTENPTWFLGLGIGSGVGWATGYGDLTQDKVNAGFGSSKLGHVLPEAGFFVSPDLLLSFQLRVQSVTGATTVRDLSGTRCGTTHICDPAKGAIAALAKMTWLYGDGPFHPYLSISVGAGQIRHLATIAGPNGSVCGSDAQHPAKCVDTVAAGPILLGPGAGFIINATPGFAFTLGLNSLLGFPQFTFHVDFNAGIAVEM